MSSLDYLLRSSKLVSPNKIYATIPNKNDKTVANITPGIIKLLENQDPFSSVIDSIEQKCITTIFTNQTVLAQSVHHLYNLKGYPIVLNIDLNLHDYTIIPSLKDLNYTTFISTTTEKLIENNSLAYEIAAKYNNPVLHFIDSSVSVTKLQTTSVDLPPLSLDHYFEEQDEEDITELGPLTLPNVELTISSANVYTLIVNLSPYGSEFIDALPSNAVLANISVYRPWDNKQFFDLIPSSVTKIVIVQRSNLVSNTKTFEPILLDFFQDFNALISRGIDQILVTNVGELSKTNIPNVLKQIVDNVNSEKTGTPPNQSLYIGTPYSVDQSQKNVDLVNKVFSLEQAYYKVLRQLFSGDNLNILNQYDSADANISSPEFGFGKFLKIQQDRDLLIDLAKTLLNPTLFSNPKIIDLLSKWIQLNVEGKSGEPDLVEANRLSDELYELLVADSDSKGASQILNFINFDKKTLFFESTWLIGSDAWSYDIGASGVHHVLTSKKNINVLIIDSEPVNNDNSINNKKLRKKDIGLYAMNYHNVYVASVAVYSSYTQLLSSFIEASQFNGPSIVLAYLPYTDENDSPLEVLKETKKAVETGYWPLYRYNPSTAGNPEDVFKLDSSVIRKALQDFLDRENKLTLLANESPDLARSLEKSASDVIVAKQTRRAEAAYNQLLDGLSGPPLHVYYASDGGNAATLAKRLANRAAARGLKSTVLSMDDIDLEELPGEENVIFITSTAGQGEFPQDGKAFWDTLKNSGTDLDLASLKFSVFGLGDSKYWPRKEDAHYYNKPSKDLFKRLELLSATPIIPLGLGDDQDADGFQTGYAEWEKQLWDALGVSNIAVPDEPKPITNEDMKLASNFLRGTIVEGLADESTGAISASDQQLTKFHGIYMQDDRDVRDVRKAQGLEPYYIFMSRIRLPGGKATPDQWLILDRLADEVGNGTVKLTTRATFQLHGIVKKNLKHSIRAMNSTLMDTLAACGDVNRNVMLSALPVNAKVYAQVSEIGYKISEYLLPQTTAYHEIWLKGPDPKDYDPSWPSIFQNRKDGPKKTLVGGNALVDVEPLYGPTYLPRKFKINIAVPPFNDVDVFSIDLGLIAIVDQATQLVKGYNMYVGGGMGTTHNNKKTYPRTGSSFGFVEPDDVPRAIECVMIVQRDHGDRSNRKHARLKYTIDDMGVEIYKQKVEELWGKKFGPEQSYKFKSNIDYFGWVKDETGLNHYTCYIENGRVEDTPDYPQKTGLKKIALYMKNNNVGHFRLTGNQHALISGITDEHLPSIKNLLKKYRLDNTDLSGIRSSSSSCVGLPTCGLAFAESERYIPTLVDKLETILEEYGLRRDSIVFRVVGCGNGCARPFLAEVALVGKAPETYNLLLGGGYCGERLNKLFRSSIKEDEILATLKPLFKRWALERQEGEHFGDFCIRAGIIKPTLEGKYFHDDVDEAAL
ncbi:probable Sulfite reductase [NADPH] subunit beta [Saccharomycodes ludwigii]|uniref:assimilatory sulfite reductase (NADPH) n=1 Tax=Saccharomycodes ludwigii TaxID=36035 RepID=A0A376B1Y1_9ASCO|nr:probable Sulfite reductase [NADPH] subunit beta [Saccharomycodes ludwigii]